MSAPSLLEEHPPELLGEGDGVPNDFLPDQQLAEIPVESVLSAVGSGMILLDTLIVWLILGSLVQFGLSAAHLSWGVGAGYVIAGLGLLAVDWWTSSQRVPANAGDTR